jgi:hypothetical protein
VLTGDGGVAERQRTGGNERRRLELVARAKEGRLRGRGPVGRGGAAGWKEKKEWATTGPKTEENYF